MSVLKVEALTPEAFAPFGAVIDAAAARKVFAINQGSTQRYHALATVELVGGSTAISLARAQPFALPLSISMLERHPLGSQAFIPLHGTRWVIVVADSPEATPRAFLADRGQGVQYHRGTWHHPLLALDQGGDFLIVDRVGKGDNCEEVRLAQSWVIGSL
ncbi:MAG TPA: ureidoglycolate lyase [Xanthomonadales bacterium]|nr:ureidoglycolate lyase [Xanthomonadales bacterium]